MRFFLIPPYNSMFVINKKLKSKLTSLSTSHQSTFHTFVIVLEVDGTIVGSGNTVIDGKFKSYLVPTPFATSEKCLTFRTANCAIMVIVIPTENTNYRGVSSYPKLMCPAAPSILPKSGWAIANCPPCPSCPPACYALEISFIKLLKDHHYAGRQKLFSHA